MLILKPHEVCPNSVSCYHARNCHGVLASRATSFECGFVDKNGRISENSTRSIFNTNGKMQILNE